MVQHMTLIDHKASKVWKIIHILCNKLELTNPVEFVLFNFVQVI